MSVDDFTGTLLVDSKHPMVRLLSEHIACLQTLRSVYAEQSGATAALQIEAGRIFEHVDQPAEIDAWPARHNMPLTKTTAFLRARRAEETARLSHPLLGQSLLLSMVSAHDAFTGRLLRSLFSLRPSLLAAVTREITIGDLEAFGDINQLRQKLIDDYVRDVLRKSHREQLTHIEKLLGMKLNSDPDLLARYQEVVQRRHLYAHNGGVANSEYVRARAQIDPGYDGRVGETVRLSAAEFAAAYVCLAEIAVKLLQATWRKTRSDELEDAEESLYNLGYNLLVFEEFELAARVLQFAVDQPRYINESIRHKNLINLAQAHKWLGDEHLCRKLIDRDWSASEDAFSLAVAVLHDNFDAAEHLMLRVGQNRQIVRQAFDDWPLFQEFRRTEQFRRAYASLYGPTAPAVAA